MTHPPTDPDLPIRQAVLVAIDFEATGSVPGYDNEPWQIGMVRMREGCVEISDIFESYLQVGERPFNPYAPGNHHALRDTLAAAPTLSSLWGELGRPWLSGPLVAHNAGTERGLLQPVAPLHDFGPWLDTLRLTRLAYPDLASHALQDVIDALGLADRLAELCPGRSAHDALYDAVGSALILEQLLAHPAWKQLTFRQAAARWKR